MPPRVSETASPAAPAANLRPGDDGPAVLQLQRALAALEFLTDADLRTGPGRYGPRTTAAVQSFQREHGLEPDGRYGPLTRAALRTALSALEDSLVKPSVVWRPSPNFNSRNGCDIDAIILHHTESNNTAGDLAWLRSKSAQVSAHYLVGRRGTIYQLVKDEMRAWHAGASAIRGEPSDVNSRSIGVEITNDGSGMTPFTEPQYHALERLVPWLARTYDIPLENILGHKDVAVPKGRKSDPASNFHWSRIRNAVKNIA